MLLELGTFESTSVSDRTQVGDNEGVLRRLKGNDHEQDGFCKTIGSEMNRKLSWLPQLGHTGIQSRDAVPPTACP